MTAFITILVIIILLGYLATSLFIVPQRREALITFFGKHTRTETRPGLHLKWPWPFNIVAARIPTDLRQVNEMLATKTIDDLFVHL
ncbi:MAG: SPFH domain-containing protein, partial [Alphaproteobacteria bacterium]